MFDIWAHSASGFPRCDRSRELTVLFPRRCSFQWFLSAVLKLMHAYCICTYIFVCTLSCKNVDMRLYVYRNVVCKHTFLCQALLWESNAIYGDFNIVRCFIKAFSCSYEPRKNVFSGIWVDYIISDTSICCCFNGDSGFLNEQLRKAADVQ